MSILTTIGPSLDSWLESSTRPAKVAAAIVFTKEPWSGDWEMRPDLQFVSAREASAGHDLGQCVVRRRYGSTKETYESAFSTKTPYQLDGYWLKIVFASEEGIHEAWQGRIHGQSRTIHGSDVARTGLQTWTAYSPLFQLMRKHLSESYWLVAGSEVLLGWVPHFNVRDDFGRLVGNRASSPSGEDEPYLFGSTSVWTRKQMVEYLLEKFANSTGGPEWTLGGETGALDEITDAVYLRQNQSVAEALRRIIEPRFGLDFTIVPAEDGYEVQVFALTARDVSYTGSTLPKNPGEVRIKSSDQHQVPEITVVRSSEHQYGKIRILGARIVICATLNFDSSSLEAKWGSSAETSYKDGTGTATDPPEEHDAARERDEFRDVYQKFGAPSSWGTGAPSIANIGGIIGAPLQSYQTFVRRTLSWLPLKENHNYSNGLKTYIGSSGSAEEQDFLPPLVWLYDDKNYVATKLEKKYIPAELAEVGISVLYNDWGVLLSASPNHRLGREHFDLDYTKTIELPKFDYEKIYATIAFESDQRTMCQYEVPGGDDSVKDIDAPWAQLWSLAPDTVVGVDDAGKLKKSGSYWRSVRDDAGSGKLDMIMAGAIARYGFPTARATATLKGYQPYGRLVGQILTAVEQAGDTEEIQAPITSVQWQVSDTGSPETIINAGFAR